MATGPYVKLNLNVIVSQIRSTRAHSIGETLTCPYRDTSYNERDGS